MQKRNQENDARVALIEKLKRDIATLEGEIYGLHREIRTINSEITQTESDIEQAQRDTVYFNNLSRDTREEVDRRQEELNNLNQRFGFLDRISQPMPSTGTTRNLKITWASNGQQIRFYDYGRLAIVGPEQPVTFDLAVPPNIYHAPGDNSARVAFTPVQIYNGYYMRHSGTMLYAHAFNENNFDFAWKLIKVGEGDDYVDVHIYNDYDNGTYLDVNSEGYLQVTYNSSATWRISPKPEAAFLY